MSKIEYYIEYETISSKIEKIQDDNLNSLILQMAASKDEYSLDDYELIITLYLCYRVYVAVNIRDTGDVTLDNQIKEDIKNIIDNIGRLEYSGSITDAILSDTFDLLLSFDNSKEYERTILSFITVENKSFSNSENIISESQFYLFINLIEAGLKRKENQLAAYLAKKLVSISHTRNFSNIEIHIELVVKLSYLLAEYDTELLIAICKEEAQSFKGLMYEYLGDFWWYYGSALEEIGDFENASKVFSECYLVRNNYYGENDWYSAIAKREELVTKIQNLNYSKECEIQYLERFLNRIEENGFPDIEKELCEIIAGKTMYIVLYYMVKTGQVYGFEHYMERFLTICTLYNDGPEPLLKLRVAKNLLGVFYLQNGKLIEAELAFLEAIDSPYDYNTEETISLEQIKLNLLMVYHFQNNIQAASTLLEEFFALLSDEDNDHLSTIDELRIYTLYNSFVSQSLIDFESDEANELKEMLSSVQNEIMDNDMNNNLFIIVCVFVTSSIMLLVENDKLSQSEMQQYKNLLLEIYHSSKYKILQDEQIILVVLSLALLCWKINDSEDLLYLSMCTEIIDKYTLPISSLITASGIAAVIYDSYNLDDLTNRSIRTALYKIEQEWKSFIKYFNDDRLVQVLTPSQLLFSKCYSILRNRNNTISLYNKVLKFKNLASLVGRERNRFLNSEPIDKELINKIISIQNRITEIEADVLFLNSEKNNETEKNKLLKLEAEVSKKLPDNINFTVIDFNSVAKAMPSDCVVVEFFACFDNNALNRKDNEEYTLAIDVFILQKNTIDISIDRVSLQNGEVILQLSEKLVNILQSEADKEISIEQLQEKQNIKNELSERLIKPISSYLNGIRRVYLAPDDSLTNLPFEVLNDENGQQLGDSYNIVRIECARDFLFSNDIDVGKGSLIIGNPEYDVEKNKHITSEKSINLKRSTSLKVDSICSLPFSEAESYIVSSYCKEKPYIGKQAHKYLIRDTSNKKNIHIATHGYYDNAQKSNSLYSSCLLFSGVSNWLRGEVVDQYDNGILTADEISRLNLKSTELVVLSSCFGGMNDNIVSKGLQGLVGAFSAAGVKYVVSNIWYADDFATAILMDAFYYYYQTLHNEPAIALRKAKKYLRSITIGKLRERKWFSYIKQYVKDNPQIINLIKELECKNDKFKPFKNESYWAGFICYRCN